MNTLMEQKRLDYPFLKESDLVFDVGGYHGDWTDKIYKRYNCNIYVFEPVYDFYTLIKNKFNKIDKIIVFNIALGGQTKTCDIYKQRDSTSLYIKNRNVETIRMKSFFDFINEHKIDKIDLMKINIEGEEYSLFKNILNNDLHLKIHNIQVQFHKHIENAELLREDIVSELSCTHEITFNYDFVWENWRLK